MSSHIGVITQMRCRWLEDAGLYVAYQRAEQEWRYLKSFAKRVTVISMNNNQKLERLRRDGWDVKFNKNMTIKYTAARKTVVIDAKNIYNLFKQIYNY